MEKNIEALKEMHSTLMRKCKEIEDKIKRKGKKFLNLHLISFFSKDAEQLEKLMRNYCNSTKCMFIWLGRI